MRKLLKTWIAQIFSHMSFGEGTFFFFFFNFFCGDRSSFCGAAGTLCFGLSLTLPMDLKARVDTPSPALLSLEQNGSLVLESTLIAQARASPNFTPWYDEATARVITQCHFRDC